MLSKYTIILACVLRVVTATQSASVTNIFVGRSKSDAWASVITAAPEAVTYWVTCDSWSTTSSINGTYIVDCDLATGATVINGPSTAAIHMTYRDQ